MKQIKTLKGLIRYLFYMDNDEKLQFGFNECWEPEEDKEISKELIDEIKKICPKLMDIDVDYDALHESKDDNNVEGEEKDGTQ